MKMHSGEVAIDAALARRLVAAQFLHLADLPIREVRSTGTVNAIYRLGDGLCARLPRVPGAYTGVSDTRPASPPADHPDAPAPSAP